MKVIHFQKYQGTGNDFVLIDQRSDIFDLSQAQIVHFCDRRFGVGGDGLMILRDHKEYDFEMIYFNSDGRLGTMCGNGGRCIVKFASDLGLIQQTTTFLAVDGVHKAEINGDIVSLEMINVDTVKTIEEGKRYELNTGSPHYVQIVDDGRILDEIVAIGKEIRYSPTYQEQGINVNLIKIINNNSLQIATYERGVEDETLSCGTGVTAAAVVFGSLFPELNEVFISAKGGDLSVKFIQYNGCFTNVVLTGPALKVFEGSLML
jgi:diaminopimelate epimerase